jgi:hypothetical protein
MKKLKADTTNTISQSEWYRPLHQLPKLRTTVFTRCLCVVRIEMQAIIAMYGPYVSLKADVLTEAIIGTRKNRLVDQAYRSKLPFYR